MHPSKVTNTDAPLRGDMHRCLSKITNREAALKGDIHRCTPQRLHTQMLPQR